MRSFLRFLFLSLMSLTVCISCPKYPGGQLKQIEIVPKSARISEQQYFQYEAIGIDSNNKAYNITEEVKWSVADTSIAEISLTGKVYGKAGGITKVYATFQNMTAEAELIVGVVAFFELPAGHYNNTSDKFSPLLYAYSANKETWISQITSSDTTGGVLSITGVTPAADAFLTWATCTGSVCISAGTNSDNITPTNFSPFIILSQNNGETWANISLNLPSDFKSIPSIPAVYCQGNFCVFGTNYSTNANPDNNYPLLMTNKNVSAQTPNTPWTEETVSLPTDMVDTDTAILPTYGCTEKFCVASGMYTPSTGGTAPYLVVRNPQSGIWSLKITTPGGGGNLSFPSDALQSPPKFHFQPGSCALDVFCIAGGTYVNNAGGKSPLLAVTSDAGESWGYKISGSNSPYDIDLASNDLIVHPGICNTGKCLVSGTYTTLSGNFVPFVAIPSVSGNAWEYTMSDLQHSLFPSDAKTNPFSISLLQGGCSASLCVVSGFYVTNTDEFYPLLYMSFDHGKTWELKISSPAGGGTKNITSQGIFVKSSCNEQACLAFGYKNDVPVSPNTKSTAEPYIVMSIDGGVTWTEPPLTTNQQTSQVITDRPSDISNTQPSVYFFGPIFDF